MADLISLQIVNEPNKKSYRVGEKFEPYGMIVRGVFSDGTTSNINGYNYSPNGHLSLSDNFISISYNGKSVNQIIDVSEPFLSGYFINRCFKNASLGNNPYINLCDGSVRYEFLPLRIGRGSYEVNLSLIYFSRMQDLESDLVKGFFKGFKTNFHQFLIKDGKDENNYDTYKYIDGESYIHTFVYNPNFSKYYDKDGFGLFLDINNKKIENQKGITIHFDSSGRLDSLSDTHIPNHIIRVEYNADGIRKIYDGRNPNKYIKFSYEFGNLRYIRTYNGEDRIKKYSINGFFGQISSIDETVNEHTCTIYKFSVNDRNRVNRFIDCLNNDAYRITYNFDQFDFNDYIFESIRKGNIINDGFVEKTKILRGSFYCRNYDEKFASDMHIIQNNGQELSYQIDTNGNVVSCFETKNSGRDLYSLEKYTGKRLSFEGQSRISINGRICESIGSRCYINEGLSSSDLNSSKYVKLCGFIKLQNEENRVKMNINVYCEDTKYIDINPHAYDVWQYFEIPFVREMDDGEPAPFSNFSISVVNENHQDVVASLCDLHFIKSKEEPLLVFENRGNRTSFDKLRGIKIKNENGQYVFHDTFYSPEYFLESDLLLTLKRKFSQNDENLIVFLNGAKRFITSFGSLKLCFENNIEIDVFDTNYFDNSSINTNKNWYFTSADANDDRVFYHYNYDEYKVISRIATKIKSEGSLDYETIYKTSSKIYNYNDQIIEEITAEGGYFNYEYFNDLSLRKKTAKLSASSLPIIVYEETRNGNIVSVNDDGVNTTILYNDNDLIEEVQLGQPNESSDAGSIHLTYTHYLDETSSYKFKKNNALAAEQKYIRDSSNLIFTYEDNVSKLRLKKSTNNKNLEIDLFESGSFIKAEENVQENSFEEIKFYNQIGTATSIKENISDYKKLYSIYANNVEKTVFWYQPNEFSEYAYLLSEIEDSFSNESTYFWYNEDNKIESVLCGDLYISYNNDPKIVIKDINFRNNEYYQISQNDYFTIFSMENNSIFATSFEFDGLNRLTKKKIISNNSIVDQNISYFDNYFSRVSSLAFGNLYTENYTYFDGNGKLKNRQVASSIINYSESYEYDVFGRIIKETNTLSNLNRTYQYCLDSSSPFFGMMISFGDQNIGYDQRGRVVSFGNKTFGYDNYGNRILKTEGNVSKSYSYVRGNLLSGINNQIQFEYDFDGRRTKKILQSFGKYHKYYYENSLLIGEDIFSSSNLQSRIRYIYDSQGISGFVFIKNNGVTNIYTYIRNITNEIIGISEGNSIVALYSYDAWGTHEVLDANGIVNTNESFIGNINPIRYKGYYYDAETGLYWLSSRYYDPEIGRFISPDSADYLDPTSINGLNLYVYCSNDPVNYCDPSGHLPQWAKWVIGIGVIGILAIATVATAGIAGVGVGAAFAAGFSGAAIGAGASGLAVTIAGSAFAGAVIGAGFGLVGGGIAGAISSGTWEGAFEGAANGFMIGSITGAIYGGINGGINYARTTPLFRSVSSQELNGIRNSGQFRSSGLMETKWFATTKSNAAQWGNAFGQNNYVGIRVLKSSLKSDFVYYLSTLDDIGAAYCIDNAYLNAIIHSMWFF